MKKQYLSPRPHRTSLKNTISFGVKKMIRVLQLNIDQLANSFNSHLEKHFNLVLPSQPNSLNPLKIERGNPIERKKNASLKSHDRTGQPVEGRLHKVQEDGYLKNRDDADKFNLAIDDENIDFNISGIPDATVKTLSKH